MSQVIDSRKWKPLHQKDEGGGGTIFNFTRPWGDLKVSPTSEVAKANEGSYNFKIFNVYMLIPSKIQLFYRKYIFQSSIMTSKIY